jgi:hypothetical protein
MTNQNLVFYSSENGDQWLLLGGAEEGDTVRHQPNVASGGQGRDVDLKDFLFREHNTPQGAALRRVLNEAANGH